MRSPVLIGVMVVPIPVKECQEDLGSVDA